jgi:hypothetical protein
MSSPTAQTFATIISAMATLELNREQVVRLIDTDLLPATGKIGRTRLLDPDALSRLAARRWLAQSGEPAEHVGLALHLGPRGDDEDPLRNGRQVVGWHATNEVPDTAWTGWWNTGPALADACVEQNLPLVLAVSGFVVNVRAVTGWSSHPHYRDGGVRFDVAPANAATLETFQGARFRPAAGGPWQRLKR